MKIVNFAKIKPISAILGSFIALLAMMPLAYANATLSNLRIENAPLTANVQSMATFDLITSSRAIATDTLKIDASFSELVLHSTTTISGSLITYFDISIADQVIILAKSKAFPKIVFLGLISP